MRKESTSSEIPISYDISEKYKPERAGFDLGSFCKIVKNLYLTLNSNEENDLGSLVSLLSQHDFLLS